VASGRSRDCATAASQKTKRLIIRSYVLEGWLHVYGRAWNNRIGAGTRSKDITQDQSGYHDGLRIRSRGNIVGRLRRHRISPTQRGVGLVMSELAEALPANSRWNP
jgi:hypothetical protein